MKKILIIAALALPLIATAQLGNLIKTEKLDTDKVEDFVDEVEIFESQVDSAGDQLYTATDQFFTILDSVTTLPSLTEAWEGIKEDIKTATDEEKEKAAEEGYLNYLKETDNRKASLDSLWTDNTIRTEIIGHLINQKEALTPVKEAVEMAFEKDKAALGSYDELYEAGKSAVSDLTTQITKKPAAALSAKPVLEDGKDALSTLATVKETAQLHVDLSTYILDKIKEAF